MPTSLPPPEAPAYVNVDLKQVGIKSMTGSSAGRLPGPEALCAPPCFLKATIEGVEHPFQNSTEKFIELSKNWKAFIGSRPALEYNHASYMQVIGMGPAIVPTLLRQLAEGDGDWIVALKYITGAVVTTPDMRGNFTAIREAWLKWGAANGFWPGKI